MEGLPLDDLRCAESGSGAVIGAIIGIVLGLALLAGLIALCCRRRQNKKRARKDAKAAYLDAQVLSRFWPALSTAIGAETVFLKYMMSLLLLGVGLDPQH
jgi:nitrate reductase gamma subunit